MIDFSIWITYKLLSLMAILFLMGALPFIFLSGAFAKEKFNPYWTYSWIVIGLFPSIAFGSFAWNEMLTTPRDMVAIGYLEWVQERQERKARYDNSETITGEEIRRYELVTWNPPKHFYVTLEDVQTKEVFTSVYVSKHCNTSSLKKGDEYNIKVQHYYLNREPKVKRFRFMNLSSTFC